MPDMLVKLYEQEALKTPLKSLKDEEVVIRRAIPPEKNYILSWIGDHFSEEWVSEADIAMSASPAKIFIAVKKKKLLGFACYDTTARGFFGPTGVDENARKKGIGTALLLRSLKALRADGYAYAVIGGAGPVEYYKKICAARIIEDSEQSIYRGMLK
ncbi:MAG: GNAT family N-acetyltransferase [Halanaerobium sp.]